jgi:lysophospholipase L1-like esterase
MQIFVFGASTTYGVWDVKGGWVSRLRASLDKAQLSDPNLYYLVYNLGISGDTTADVLERFDTELSARLKDAEPNEEKLIIFSLGNNDAATMKDGQQQVALPEFESNLAILAEKALKTTSKVAFASTFPADETKTMPVSWAELSYSNPKLEEYRNVMKRVCKAKGITFIDVYGKFIKKNYQQLLQDGLHPNSKGHQKIFVAVRGRLQKEGIL